MTIKNLSNILRMNQRTLTMICLKIILILQYLVFWQKKLYEAKNKNKNKELAELTKVRWSNLKDEIKKMSEDEKETEQPAKILKIVEEILEFNKQNQSGKGLKILTPNQMLSRLPISLAQLKAGNNSEKLKNEIRQILHSLYRSKKLTKQFQKSLVGII